MFYKAMKLMLNAHEGMMENQERPYFLHPMRVMNNLYRQMSERTGNVDTELLCVALLHDYKYSGGNISALYAEGMTARVIEGVEALSQRTDESLDAFLDRVRNNKDALIVKKMETEDILERTDELEKYRMILAKLEQHKNRDMMAA